MHHTYSLDVQDELFTKHPGRGVKYCKLNPLSIILHKSVLGQTIVHYQIAEQLGCGGMRLVYKAFDLILERFVTIKFLPFHPLLDDNARERFIQEAKSLACRKVILYF